MIKIIIKRIVCLSSWLLFVNIISAQNYMINTGCDVKIHQGAKVHVNGSLINNNTGLFFNEDTIYVTGNINNSAANNLFDNPFEGAVLLTGANQNISGTSIPYFNIISLLGSGIKSLGTDVRVKGCLNLNDREFASGDYIISVDNTDTNAIKRTTGFVSSSKIGFLKRSMLGNWNYLFPTGSSTPVSKYRPVVIIPPNSNPDTFGVNMINYEASLDAYDINTKENSLCLVNNAFYHNITRHIGNASQVGLIFFFDTLIDGDLNKVAHWQGITPQWENTANPANIVYNQSPMLSEIHISKWGNYNPTPFAMALSNPNAGIVYEQQPLCEIQLPITLIPYVPGGIWSGIGITDPVNGIFDPQVSGPGIFTIYYTAANSAACTAIDSVVLTVEPDNIQAAFTTNILGNVVDFTNNSQNASYYYWKFGDGTNSYLINPQHTYTSTGNFTVKLYASNACGTDSSEYTINITVTEISENSYCDNIISVFPNPFNSNTKFNLSLEKPAKVNVSIYNITGQKIITIINDKLISSGIYNYDINETIFNYKSGIYILKAEVETQTVIKRIIYIPSN